MLQQKGNFPCKIYPDSDGQWIAQEFSSLNGSLFPLPHCRDEINAGFPCGPALVISDWFSTTARRAASSDLHSAAEDLLGKVFWGDELLPAIPGRNRWGCSEPLWGLVGPTAGLS